MVFFFIAAAFMYIGRKVGWMLSKSILYTSPPALAGAVSAIWGAGVAIAMFGIIRWQEPNIILKIIMGYALGWYVSIPNFGFLQESSIPEEARKRHSMISIGPAVVYLITMTALSLSN
jgi:hypothetical protein